MSANFRIEGKVYELIDLLTLSNIKGEKKSMRFVLNFFVDTSGEWDVLFVFKLFHFLYYIGKWHFFGKRS